jgi:hypothetical protein
MRHLSLLLVIGTLVCIPAASRAASHRAGPGTVIVDASDFVQLMPARNILTEARPVSADNWLFNNSGMVLRAAEDSVARVQIATAGRYHLRVRTAGSRDGTFKIALGGQVAAATFGGTATTWTDGGAFDLPAGELEVRLTEVTPSPVLDVIVLTRAPPSTTRPCGRCSSPRKCRCFVNTRFRRRTRSSSATSPATVAWILS